MSPADFPLLLDGRPSRGQACNYLDGSYTPKKFRVATLFARSC